MVNSSTPLQYHSTTVHNRDKTKHRLVPITRNLWHCGNIVQAIWPIVYRLNILHFGFELDLLFFAPNCIGEKSANYMYMYMWSVIINLYQNCKNHISWPLAGKKVWVLGYEPKKYITTYIKDFDSVTLCKSWVYQRWNWKENHPRNKEF